MVTNPTSIHEDVVSIPGLAQRIKGSDVAVNCDVGHRRASDPALLRLCCRPADYSSNLPPCLGTSICLWCGPKKEKKEEVAEHRTIISSSQERVISKDSIKD